MSKKLYIYYNHSFGSGVNTATELFEKIYDAGEALKNAIEQWKDWSLEERRIYIDEQGLKTTTGCGLGAIIQKPEERNIKYDWLDGQIRTDMKAKADGFYLIDENDEASLKFKQDIEKRVQQEIGKIKAKKGLADYNSPESVLKREQDKEKSKQDKEKREKYIFYITAASFVLTCIGVTIAFIGV
ncbi:MAG: hypothetical protein K0U45_09245 [Alphaproteobacteria bacterium]|nr:hypothetical protein [Alphaproteobacteria bacterium]